ncbi:hypothetical protein L1987_89713 [Smallanthus sonchifolius]|nr:hypothetical protein L1987_89713 [Smallanthus sonchifolius]
MRERTTRNRTAREEKRTVALGVFRRVKLPARIKLPVIMMFYKRHWTWKLDHDASELVLKGPSQVKALSPNLKRFKRRPPL